MLASQENAPGRLWRVFVLRVSVLLALSGLFFFAYNFIADSGQIQEAAIKRARAHFRDTLLTLNWAGEYGGVYVPRAPRNPGGARAKDAIVTPGTHRFLHPAEVIGEISRLTEQEDDHRFRLVGRQARDPRHAPDAWESAALDSLIGGRTEVFERVVEDGRTLFRYMAPVYAKPACLRCHTDEGFSTGDVQGGIGISFDIDKLVVDNRRHQATTGALILAAFLLSFLATHWFSRRLDRELGNINRRYADLLQSTESIVWEADPETMELSFVSDQVQRLLGYRPDECMRQAFWSRCLAPQDISRVWDACKAHRDAEQPLRIDYRMIDSQGNEHWMQDVVVYADRGDGCPVLRGVMLDISERKQAEKRVQDMLAEQYAILQNALVGIALIRHGQIVSCNHRFEEIFGAERFSLAGAPVSSLYPNAEVFADTVGRVRAAFDAGRSFTREVMLRRRDGTLFWGAMTGQLLDPISPDNGSIWIYADISERMAAQTALKEQQARLEQLVEQRTADLRQALDAAHSADRAKDEFLANVSHEMRTPLNAVIGLTGLAHKHSNDPAVRDHLEKVAAAGQTLLQIINDLLDLSKIAAGHFDLETIPFRPGEIIERMKLLVAHHAEEKGLRFDASVDPALPAVVLGDPLRVEQIVLNLLSNAIKFTERGRIGLRLLRHDAGAGKVGLTIVVADTGRGIAPAEQARLFQPFAQADNSVSRTHGGTGLGLALCSRFAAMMQGDIRVDSSPGAGSTFTVRLVLGEAGEQAALPVATAPLPRPVDQIRYRDTRVLVVDDQPINRQIVRELLREVGIVCDEADNGRSALAALAAHPADYYALVFMDVQMPELDGHSATRRLREDPACAALPVIAMTAFAMAHERQACLAAGMNDHIGKPFETGDLYRLLAQWVPAERQYLATTASAPLPAALAAGPDDVPPIDGVDTLAGLNRFAGNHAAYRRWLGHFVEEAGAPLAAAAAELAAGERAAALKTLHTFKGHCGMLGMTALWQAVVELEGALKAEQPAAATDALFAAVRQCHAETLARVRAAIGG